jgi:hypothetical protein
MTIASLAFPCRTKASGRSTSDSATVNCICACMMISPDERCVCPVVYELSPATGNTTDVRNGTASSTWNRQRPVDAKLKVRLIYDVRRHQSIVSHTADWTPSVNANCSPLPQLLLLLQLQARLYQLLFYPGCTNIQPRSGQWRHPVWSNIAFAAICRSRYFASFNGMSCEDKRITSSRKDCILIGMCDRMPVNCLIGYRVLC